MTDDDRPEDADEEAIRKRREELVARGPAAIPPTKGPTPMPCLSAPPDYHLQKRHPDAMPVTCLSIASPTPCLSAPRYVEPPPPRAPSMTRTVIVALLVGVLIGALAAIAGVWLTL